MIKTTAQLGFFIIVTTIELYILFVSSKRNVCFKGVKNQQIGSVLCNLTAAVKERGNGRLVADVTGKQLLLLLLLMQSTEFEQPDEGDNKVSSSSNLINRLIATSYRTVSVRCVRRFGYSLWHWQRSVPVRYMLHPLSPPSLGTTPPTVSPLTLMIWQWLNIHLL